MERRTFLRSACMACVAPGLGSLAAFLPSCASAPVYRGEMKDGTIRVPALLFATGEIQVIRADGSPDDIALVKGKNGGFEAFILRCTHADNPLSYRGTEFTCSLHGSRFDSGGNVTHGPATLPLRRLPALPEGDVIVIQLNSGRAFSHTG